MNQDIKTESLSSQVFILATCRNESLLRFTTLVFDSIRVGFPSSNVTVIGNALPDYASEAVGLACQQTNCQFTNGPETIHHIFVEKLCGEQHEPFILLDTDMIMYDEVESWKFDKSLAGWRIPEWKDVFTGAVTRARLHTSLLFINPVKLRAEIEVYHSQFPDTPFNPKVNLFYPLCYPFKGRGYFSDTCSMLYHAVGGQSFTERQLDAYCHFQFGTISDIVLPRLPRQDQDNFRLARAAILQNPARGKGAWRHQMNYYSSHPA